MTNETKKSKPTPSSDRAHDDVESRVVAPVFDRGRIEREARQRQLDVLGVVIIDLAGRLGTLNEADPVYPVLDEILAQRTALRNHIASGGDVTTPGVSL